MTALDEHFALANGVHVPRLGFGTWQIPDGKPAYDAVSAALATGYRHIDTARAYGNEASVARAIADSGIDRSGVFITTKVPAEIKTYAGALASFEETMAALATDYVDLYLIHAPWPWSEIGADYSKGNAEVWRALEEILTSGRARSIGVSNFDVDDLTTLLTTAEVTPQVNQIRYFVGHTQAEVTKYCQDNNILVEGYSPLATGAILDNDEVGAIAAKYSRSVAQLCIRYLLEKDVLPLPKTTSPARMKENADVDFAIDADDLAYLDGLVDTDR